ncbi:MAG: hypothetical protein MI810_22115 [Flavobacteriales bacterium]|nr:hypothetical protein [Flavobacteriales bacterium]
MKYLFISLIATLSLVSCNLNEGSDTEAGGSADGEELAKLRSENRDLKDQLVAKDSMLNESIMLFNEIEHNLAMINLKEDEIRLRSNDVELAEDGKQWILQEIQNINYLREANAKKVEELSASLDDKNLQIEEFQKLVSELLNKIQVQEEEIEMLGVELADLDREYVELLEAYQEQTELAIETMQELNSAYYAYGSTSELLANEVIVKEGGFIGIGKKATLKSDFNDEYFTPIDMMKTKSIEVIGKKVKFITDHPSSSYELISNGDNHQIKIKDPKSFWKVSKYLVVVVD